MTCIVGLEADGKVYMGGDSAATSSWDVYISPVRKVFLNEGFLIAKGMAPEKRVLAALEAAGHFSNGVYPPYYVECLGG